MSITNGYATLAELKIKLGISDSTQDAKLEKSVENASRLIDQITGQLFYSKSLTSEKVDIFGPSENGVQIKASGYKLYFPAPVVSISSITEDSNSLTEDEDFFIYKSIGKIEKGSISSSYGSCWSFQRKAIVITGVIGYSTTPASINEICLLIAAVISGLSKATYQAEDGGDPVEVIRNSVPKWVFDKLDTFKWANV